MQPNSSIPLSCSGSLLIVQLACISLDKILILLLASTKIGGGGILLFNSLFLELHSTFMIMNE